MKTSLEMIPQSGSTGVPPVSRGAFARIGRFLSRSRVLAAGAVLAGLLATQAPAQETPDLNLWNSPAFRRQVVESYMAETDIEPRVTEDEREAMQEILELIGNEQMDEAAAAIQKEIKRNAAASAVFDFTLANIYFQQDKLDDATAYYQKAVEKYSKFRRAWKNMGIIAVRQNRFADALPALTRVVELGENNAITYGLMGFAYSNEENFLSAESAYRMAILLDPQTMDWKMGLARAFFKQERYAEAVALTGQLLKDEPERTDLWLLQANAYLGKGEPKEAAEIYELVDLLGGSTFDSLNILGDIYVNEELYELAANSYIKAIQMESDGKQERAIRAAKVLAARGAFDETKRIVQTVQTTYGSGLDQDARIDLLKLEGRLAVAEGAGDEEVRVLKEIVELDPLDGEALLLLGQHAARNEDPEQAIFYYERAANLEGFEADAKVRHAQLLASQEKYDEALPLLRRAQQVNYRENVQEYLEQVERVAKQR
ncbi:MAG: tetratricopeptide repeat protein [Sumerlaeia bacterium]